MQYLVRRGSNKKEIIIDFSGRLDIRDSSGQIGLLPGIDSVTNSGHHGISLMIAEIFARDENVTLELLRKCLLIILKTPGFMRPLESFSEVGSTTNIHLFSNL